MSERRPLCLVALLYTFGIGCYYIFSIPIFVSISGILLSCIAAILLYGKKSVFLIVLALVFFVGSFVSYLGFTKEDPLQEFATSPYTNSIYPNSSNISATYSESSNTNTRHSESTNPNSDETGKNGKHTIRGVVMKYRATDYGGYRLNVRSEGRNILVRVSGSYNASEPLFNADDLLGREICFSGIVEIPEKSANPGSFNYRIYLLTEGIRIIVKGPESALSLSSLSKSDKSEEMSFWRNPISFFSRSVLGIYNSLAKIKYGFLRRAEGFMSEQNYAVFAGILFGDSTAIDDDIYEVFQKNGVAHILSVSGIHVAIVYAFINMIFGNRRTLFSCIIALLLLLVYAALSEFSPSVVRAFLMIAVHIISKLTNKRYDLLTGTCIAALIMLILNPLILFGVGFQLSFLAVLILAFAIPFVQRFTGYRDSESGLPLSVREKVMRLKDGPKSKYLNFVANMMIPLLCIQIIMLPVTIWMFNYVSLSSVFLNLPVVAISGIILPLGIIALLLSMLVTLFSPAMHIFGILAESTEILIEWMLNIAVFADKLPLSHFNVTSPKIQWLFLFYAIFFIITSEKFRVLFSRKAFFDIGIFAAVVVTFVVMSWFSPVGRQNDAALTFVDVGQGDCLHIRTPDGRNYLVDGGGVVDYSIGKKVLKPYLLKNGVSELDAVFVTHLHTDHFQGLRELSLEMKMGRIFTYGSENDELKKEVIEEIKKESAFMENDIEYIVAGDRIQIGEGVYIEVLYPPASDVYEEDENKTSLMFKLSYEGITVLMTGDIGFDGENALLGSLDEAEGDNSREAKRDMNVNINGNMSSNINRSAGIACDILKVGHHGSKYSTSKEFLDAVNPSLAIIQVGRNTFGHPTSDVLEKLQLNDIIIHRNDLEGAIMLNIKNGRILSVESNGKTG